MPNVQTPERWPRSEMARKILPKLFLYAMLFLLPRGILAQSQQPFLLEDGQAWAGLQVLVPLRQKIDLVLSGSTRLGQNVSHWVYERGGTALLFRLGKHFTLSPMYNYIATQPLPGRHGRENRFSLDNTFNFSLCHFILSDRNLFERRLQSPVNSSRYRNALQLSRPVKMEKISLLLFVSDEFLYDWKVNTWSRNRFSVGVSKDLAEKISLDLYYLRQNGKSSNVPRDLHVIGTTLKIRL